MYAAGRLVAIPQWVGLEVHALAEEVLRSPGTVDPAVVRARRLAVAADAVARARGGQATLDPRKDVRFVELSEGDDPGDERWTAALDDLATQSAALLDHPLFRRLLAVPERLVEVERFGRVQVGGVSVSVSLDVLVRDGRGGMVVIDWKTGRDPLSDVASPQLLLYARYVADRYRVPWSQIAALVGATRTGEHLRARLDPADAAALDDQVAASAAQMRSVLPDPARDEVPESAFEPLPLGHAACEVCRFRGPCGRGMRTDYGLFDLRP